MDRVPSSIAATVTLGGWFLGVVLSAALSTSAVAQFDPLHNNLKCYEIKDQPIITSLRLDNQFEPETVVELIPRFLCVPTQKTCCHPGVPACSPIPCPPEPSPNQPAPVDHFKCYEIVAPTPSPTPTIPVAQGCGVTSGDPNSGTAVCGGECPLEFPFCEWVQGTTGGRCTCVDHKCGEPGLACSNNFCPDQEQTCTTLARGGCACESACGLNGAGCGGTCPSGLNCQTIPSPTNPTILGCGCVLPPNVTLDDQFGSETLNVGRPRLFCVPVVKVVNTPPMPTPTRTPCEFGQCVVTFGFRCTGQPCVPGVPCPLPNEFCDLNGRFCPCEPPCGFNGTPPVCGGACPPDEKCQILTSPTNPQIIACGCGPPPTRTPTATPPAVGCGVQSGDPTTGTAVCGGPCPLEFPFCEWVPGTTGGRCTCVDHHCGSPGVACTNNFCAGQAQKCTTSLSSVSCTCQ